MHEDDYQPIAHPLTGVKPWHREPPEHWDPERVARLYRPHLTGTLELHALRDHATMAYSRLRDITAFIEGDLSSLFPYRARAAWRIARAKLVELGHLEPDQPLVDLPQELVHLVQPPPAPKNLAGYNPLEDQELDAWIGFVEGKIVQAHLSAPTKNDKHYGRYQTSALTSPYFARAGWPTWFELLATEAANCEDVTTELIKGGALQAKRFLREGHNIIGLEADALIQLAAGELRRTQELLQQDDIRALYIARADDLIATATKELRLNARISATKLGAMLCGALQTEAANPIDDLMDSITDPRTLDAKEIEKIAPKSQDPLQLSEPSKQNSHD